MLGSCLERGKCLGISLTWVNPVHVRQLKMSQEMNGVLQRDGKEELPFLS